MAKKIVAEFGEKTLEVIAKSPNELLKIPGIGKKQQKKFLHLILNKANSLKLWFG